MTPNPNPNPIQTPQSPTNPSLFRYVPPIRGLRFDAPSHNMTPNGRTPNPLVFDGGQDGHDSDEVSNEENTEDHDDENGVDEEGADVGEEEGGIEEVPMEIDNTFDPSSLGMKEIGNLASWTVSSSKPGCGVEALRDEDTNMFWQSDGPQPHHLNIHFSRLVSIVAIRLFLDFEADESYTPTRITLLAGTGYHDLIPFSALNFEQPKGWIDVPLDHVGGGEDGKTLRAFLVQVRIIENHQNGKDTHVRGLKIYASDDRVRGAVGLNNVGDDIMQGNGKAKSRASMLQNGGTERTWLLEPDWMGEPELR